MNILLAEDEYLQAFLLETELVHAGHTVLGPVANVQDGLDLAEQSPPDLALVDITLKNGGKGTELARELATRWQVPSLFVSAELAEARDNKDVALGCVTKPYQPVMVLRSVEVAKALIDGQAPSPGKIPDGLELFSSSSGQRNSQEFRRAA